MDPASEIEMMAGYTHRIAGSDAERRAAVHLQGRVESLGREAELQPLLVRPRFALAHAINAGVAVAGSVVAVSKPVLGLALVALAAVSAFLDVAGILHLARRLTGRRASQNIESREHGEKPGVLLVVAAYDQGRDGRALAAAARLLRDLWLAMLVAMLAILACCGLRAVGVEGTVLTVLQFIPTLLLLFLVPALVDAELAEPAPDPARDAGVATAIRLSDELGGRLEHFDLWLVLTGSERPFALGMGGWLRRRRKGLDPQRAAVVSIGSIGVGALRYTRREGPLLPLRVHSGLRRLCAEIAEDEAVEDSLRAAPHVGREPSNAAAAIARGLPAVTVSSAGADTDPAAAERAYAFCRELIGRLDAEIGPVLPGARAADRPRTSRDPDGERVSGPETG